MPLHLKAEDVQEHRVELSPDQGSGTMVVRKAYGREASMMVAERVPGYHTRPHVHDCEQINYVVSGEIWFFIEDRAFHCRQGDFMRIPRGRVHWAWNKSDSTAVVAETHSPPLSTDPGNDPNSLLEPDEPEKAVNIFVPYDAESTEAHMHERVE